MSFPGQLKLLDANTVDTFVREIGQKLHRVLQEGLDCHTITMPNAGLARWAGTFDYHLHVLRCDYDIVGSSVCL